MASTKGMHGEVYTFELREGGIFRMSWKYDAPEDAGAGKTTDNADSFQGKFLELVQDRLVVEEVVFQSTDPAFADPMRITTVLNRVDGGTLVEVACSEVPTPISRSDHLEGINSSLENLAAFAE